MPDKRQPNKERILPLLSFKILIEVPFSIATNETTADRLRTDIGNLNKEFSSVCKEILFGDLKLKDKSDFDDYFSDSTNLAKDKIYKDLGICRKKSFGNDYMIVKLQNYVNKKKNGE